MVQVGHFTVNLVRADTKEVFKEYTGPAPDHNVYAEVEPGVDYFIQVESTRGEVIVRGNVDGVYLGYLDTYLKPFKDKYLGAWERTNGESKTIALHFNKAAQATKQEGQTNSSMLTGKVDVEFYEFGAQIEVDSNDDVVPQQLKSDIKVAGKKCVLSGNGSHVTKDPSSTQHGGLEYGYELGGHICTITLHYCTAVGLILNKILDAPPSSQESDSNESKRAKVKPEKKRSASAVLSPDEKESKKVATPIDLTGDDDDGGNERWL